MVILGAGIVLGLLYSAQKGLRRRLMQRLGERDSQGHGKAVVEVQGKL